RDEAGFQRAEPIIVFPAECGQTQRAAGQFRERVMRGGFAAVDEKWNFVTRKNPAQRIVITLEPPKQNSRFAKTSAAANEPQNFMRGQGRFRFGIRTNRRANRIG